MTIRVLHLLQPRWTGPAALDAVATLQREGASRGIAHHAFVIGGSADERAARRMGVWCLERMTDARPARLILSGSRTLRRVLARRTAFDALHAWTPAAAIVARLAAPEIPCAMREPWWAPMDVERLKGVDRAEARRAWGVEEGEIVVALAGGASRRLDAFRFAMGIGVATAAGRRVVGLAPPGSHSLERALRLRDGSPAPWRMVVADEPAWRVAIGAEAVVCTVRRDRSGGPVRADFWAGVWAGAAGAEVIADECEAAERVLGGVTRAALCSASPRFALGGAIVRACDRVRNDGRGEADARLLERHDPSRWLGRMARLYEAAARSGGARAAAGAAEAQAAVGAARW